MRVLACTSREAEARLRAALEGDEILMAFTFDDAIGALRQHEFEVVIVGMMFDESRALDLVQAMRSTESFPTTAFVGIRGAKIARVLSPEVFDVPMKALGAVEVIDFGPIPNDKAGNGGIRARIHASSKTKSDVS